MPDANPSSLMGKLRALGMGDAELVRVFRTFNAVAPAFRRAAETVGAAPAVTEVHHDPPQ